jgi:hypothetical protein
MKDDPRPETTAKSPKARFMELGAKIMSVPKAEIDARDKTWRTDKTRRAKRTK